DTVVVGPKYKGEIESVDGGLGSDDHPGPRSYGADPRLGILVLAKRIPGPICVTVRAIEVGGYLIIRDNQRLFRCRHRFGPVQPESSIRAIEVVRRGSRGGGGCRSWGWRCRRCRCRSGRRCRRTATLASHGDKCSRRTLIVVLGCDPGSASQRCT